MSRAYRFATIALIWILAMFIHYFATIVFSPTGAVYGLAAPGIGTYIQSGWRDQMYLVFVQYIPLLFIGGSLIWGFAKEYENAVVGVRR